MSTSTEQTTATFRTIVSLLDGDQLMTLLDLADDPDALAREAFAVLDRTSCTNAIALVSTRNGAQRVIDTKDWDHAEALAAARDPDAIETLEVGEDRDETLEIVVRVRAEPEHRQVIAAVRRVLATAAELRRCRKYENEASASPPAEGPESRRETNSVSELEIRLRLDQPLPVAVEMLEQRMIRCALARSRGRVEEAARLLGISRKGLFLKRRRWNLDHKQAS